MSVPILGIRRHWTCPNCTVEDVTTEVKPHSRFHRCKGLHGLTAPMVQSGTKAKVYVREREDYIAEDKVQLHGSRPVMSVVTERNDGQDVVVFAPTATAGGAMK